MPKGEEQGFNPEEQRTYTRPGVEKVAGSEARREREIYENLVNRRLGPAVDTVQIPDEVKDELIDALKDQAKDIAKEQIRAEKDELTGLWRKEGLAGQFEVESNYMETYKPDEVMVLVSIDLDHFKTINDTLGHEGADKVLEELGVVLKNTIRKTDIGGRPGGDEFVVVLTRIKKQDIDKVVGNLLENIGKVKMPRIGNLTASLGVNIIEKDQIEQGNKIRFEEEREKADFAAYVAKRNGRNQIVRADSEAMQETEKGEDWFLMMQKEKNGREMERYSKFPELLTRFLNLLEQQAKLDYELYLQESQI